ncbi:MAG: ATP-binding protein [Gemmatimonadales bacterium]|jgi:DNA polymerase-3 subunit delta'
MPIVPLHGHENIRRRLRRMIDASSLPGSVLFEGPRGIGKQRLALWLAQLLVCERADKPCGACMPCRSVLDLRHPDVFWVYPRPRLTDANATSQDVIEDLGEASLDRLEKHGLYARPSGSEAIFLATTLTIVGKAAMSPSMGRRKIFIVGDAERMVAQEGSDQAANAFLKLLEEPPADTTILLTSSEPGALLPTVRSRVISIRCAPLADSDVLAFVREPEVKSALDDLALPRGDAERVALARGAPGDLLSTAAISAARASALKLLDSAATRGPSRYATSLAQGSSGARGAFSDMLAELNVVLRERAESAIAAGDTDGAYAAARATIAVTEAQARSDGNVSPQLTAAVLMDALQGVPA